MSAATRTDKAPEVLASKFYRPISNVPAGAWSESILQLRKTYKEHQAKPIPAIVKSRLDGPSVSWKVFRRLNQAISYADSSTKDCMVFSYEERTPENSGQRLFLVTHPQHMWLNHKLRPLEERCTYEVIREGFPCKLYFDLEFNKLCNPCKDGIKMTEIFIKCINAFLCNEFNLKFSISDVLWLDASTLQKYSCHLILQLNNIAFRNNIEAGRFVSLLLSEIRRRTIGNEDAQLDWPSSEELKYMFVHDKEGRSIHFCDGGVYTKNRNFRMFLSTKYGKKAPLLLSEHNQYVPNMSAACKDRNEAIFYDCLITYFRTCDNFTRLLGYDLDTAAKNVPKRILQSKNKMNIPGNAQNTKSPYPEVDSFILTLIKDDIATGFIRKRSYLETEEVLVYEIGNYRYCSNIGRYHKSNNIMIIVDMKRKVYYQKCHDPECRAQSYKSISQSLPENIMSLYNVPDDFFDSDCFSQFKSAADVVTKLASEHNKENSETLICDDFLEDISLDSYPFTQLQSADMQSDYSVVMETTTKETGNEDQSLEESFLVDTSFDDLNMEDFESCFMKCTAKNESSSSQNSTTVVDNIVPKNKLEERSSGEEMSIEDELMMAEAAAVIESTMDDAMFLEETVF